jgi:hypothetical protein
MEQKVSEKFIREMHEEACASWKNKIEDYFPEVFVIKVPEIQSGRWYIDTRDNERLIFVFNSETNGRGAFKSSMGFGATGKWNNIGTVFTTGDLVLVDNVQELQSAIHRRLVAIGYNDGAKAGKSGYTILNWNASSVTVYLYSPNVSVNGAPLIKDGLILEINK